MVGEMITYFPLLREPRLVGWSLNQSPALASLICKICVGDAGRKRKIIQFCRCDKGATRKPFRVWDGIAGRSGSIFIFPNAAALVETDKSNVVEWVNTTVTLIWRPIRSGRWWISSFRRRMRRQMKFVWRWALFDVTWGRGSSDADIKKNGRTLMQRHSPSTKCVIALEGDWIHISWCTSNEFRFES